MENRAIKNIKKQRNMKCKNLGNEYLYDPNIDLYKLKKSVHVMKDKPFILGDCVKEGDVKYAEKNNMYLNVPNERTCKRLNGVWNGSMLNRENRTDRGICWKSNTDMKCASNENEVLITKLNVHKKILDTSKKNCNKVKSCIWNKKRCLSKERLSNNHDYLPDDFPKNLVDNEKTALVVNESITKDPIIKYSPLMGEGNRCLSVEFDKNELSLAQQVVRYVGKSFSQNETSNRGVLAWHSTGSGKTITSMAIIDSFWKSKKNIVFVSSIEALQSNPPTTFYKNAKKYFTRFGNKDEKDIEKQFKQRNVKFMTFSQLAHFLLISNPLKSVKTDKDKELHRNFLANSVLIIDEVQNIFHPLPNQRTEHNALKTFLLSSKINETNRNMKVFILTATPGDSIEETLDLLNIVRDRSKKSIMNPDVNSPSECKSFMKSINGLISYFNSSKDTTRFPKIIADNHYKLEMLQEHFEKYVEAFNKTLKKDTDFDALTKSNAINKYYKTLRKYSNMQYNFEAKDPVTFFSNKLPKLLEVIESKSKDKHYVYSAFYERKGFGGQGIRAVAQFLESELGYVRIDSTNDLNKLKSGKKGYVLAITNELNNKEHLKQLVTMYNNPDLNVNVFLASQSYNEGVDLKNTKHIHIFEPMLTFNAEKQTIGRAVRFCSHSSMPYDSWTTTIHRYFSTLPKDLSIYDTKKTERKVAELDAIILNKEAALNDMKGQKKVTEIRNMLKSDISESKKQKRTLAKAIKEINKMNLDSIVSIDEKIYKESIERIYEQSIVMEMMKEKAIDCYMMHKYHENGGEDIECK